MGTMTYHEALTLALYEEMRRDERVLVIGRGGSASTTAPMR
jgi:pyruvate/2-oxoglutarate/acetoin dehydrogenase E1 component